jgi:transposase
MSMAPSLTREEQETLNRDQQLLIAAQAREIADLKQKLAAMAHRLDQMSRRMFGHSSERVVTDPNQDRIDLGDQTPAFLATEPLVSLATQVIAIAPTPEAKKQPKRRPIPETLPADERIVELPESERTLADGRVLIPVGERRAERLDVQPAAFRRQVTITIIYGLPESSEAMLCALPPRELVADGIPTTRAVAQIAYEKFGNHKPLYRQQKDFERIGVEVARSTMCGWLSTLGDFVMPIAHAVAEQVLKARFIHTDDTPVDLLEPGNGTTKTARFWVYLGDGQAFFEFSDNHSSDWSFDTLKDYCGHICCDALPGYRRVFALGHAKRDACLAHIRRKFFDARKTDEQRAEQAVALFQILYDVERTAKNGRKGEELASEEFFAHRFQLRQQYARPVIDTLKALLDRWAIETTPDSVIGKAVAYALNQWGDVGTYLEAGYLPIDNNPAENALRPIAIGRKNYLFIGSEAGGQTAATLYTLIQSCRLQRIDPAWYLQHVCERLLADCRIDPATLTPASIAHLPGVKRMAGAS